MASLLEKILRDKMLLWRLFHHQENSDLDGDHFEVGSKSRSDLAIGSSDSKSGIQDLSSQTATIGHIVIPLPFRKEPHKRIQLIQ